MYRIAVVEDEAENRKQVFDYIVRYGDETGAELDIREFPDGESIAEEAPGIFDIIFMDIEMPGISGMDAARHIRNHDENVVIVFITNMAQYAIHGYSVGALDFVLKPINYYAFSLRLTKALERVLQKKTAKIALDTAEGRKLLDTEDIYYIETAGRGLNYHTREGTYSVRGTMQEAENFLKDYHFVRCNYWYLVNLKYVSGISKNLVLIAEEKLEISRRNRTAFIKALTDYIGGGL